jgi:hypothetical protein
MADKALSNSSADTFISQIRDEMRAIEEVQQGKGQLCVDALERAFKCGQLLLAAQESVKAEKRKWLPWLEANIGMPNSTANLYIRLAKHEDEVRVHILQIGDERMSLRQAAALIPKTPEGEKRAETAKAKAAAKKEEKEALAKARAKASITPEEIVENLGVDELFQVITTTLDADQLLDLSTRLNSYLDEQPEEEGETADEAAVEEATEPAAKELSTVERLKQQYGQKRI